MDNYRWDIPRDCSMAYLLFRQHHIQFNNMYWAYLYGTATLGREAKKAKGIFESPSEYLVNLKGPNVNYSAVSCWDNWWKYFEDFEGLTRINLLLDANSYFEVYLRNIYCLAMESRPDVLLDRATIIDGFKLYKTQKHYRYSYKHDKTYLFIDNLLKLTKGDWHSRLEAFEKIFGNCPDTLKGNCDQLNEIRKIRNDVGHFFGRDKKSDDGAIRVKLDKMTQLKDDRLKKLLNVIYTSAGSIDKMLFPEFVGSYESVMFCLQCAEKNHIGLSKNRIGDIVGLARQEMGEGGYPIGREYLTKALEYFLTNS